MNNLDLDAQYKKLSTITEIQGLLMWDEHTMMPSKAGPQRGEQNAYLASLYQSTLLDSRFVDYVDSLDESKLNPEGQASLKIMQTKISLQKRVPASLVEELARAQSACHHAWVEAREKNEYAIFSVPFQKVLDLKIQQASCWASSYSNPLIALMQEFEPGIEADDFLPLFEKLKGSLKGILKKVEQSSNRPDSEIVSLRFNESQLSAFSRTVVERFGFDVSRGRIDSSIHPFCGTVSGINDVRLKTRFSEQRPLELFFALCHEAGHGMYEQGLPLESLGLPVCTAGSISLHESQSRWWENFVARCRPFWEANFEALKHGQSDEVSAVGFDDFLFAVNRIEPSLIRVAADEATYNLHVIIRTELEQRLLDQSLSIADLPKAWNQAYQDYLGIVPTNLSDGVLQDMHWAGGAFGYFPTYTIGNMMSAQIQEAILEDFGEMDFYLKIRNGDYSEILKWHRKNVHSLGSLKSGRDIVEAATGKKLGVESLVKYLEKKVSTFY